MATDSTTVTRATLRDLTPDPDNARLHNEQNIAMIAESLQENGAWRSIAIDEDGVIFAGNGVYDAAAQTGLEDVIIVDAPGDAIVAVRRSGLTPAQKARYALQDNRAAEHASWDLAVIARLAEESPETTAGLWSKDALADIARLHGAVPSLDDLEQEYGEPEEHQLWPVLRLQVSPETMERYESLMSIAPGQREGERFAAILDSVDSAVLGELAASDN
jgi:hypothetical protein